jgi:hypothetical protein
MREKIGKKLGIKEKIRESILGSGSVLGGRCVEYILKKNTENRKVTVHRD